MTEEMFREDSYLKSCTATATAVNGNAVVLDRTVFYPAGGGQPGDQGVLSFGGREASVIDCFKDRDTGAHCHVLAEGAPLPEVGETVEAVIDWERRYRLMRMHTALHLLCGAVDGAVTGGSVGADKGRLDFDLEEAPDKEELAERLNAAVDADADVSISWISDAELDANPEMVRTMSVKPPRGTGKVRVIEVAGVDLQPCGGTHVKKTGEIGRLRVGKIEKKGRLNRRINIHFDEM